MKNEINYKHIVCNYMKSDHTRTDPSSEPEIKRDWSSEKTKHVTAL